MVSTKSKILCVWMVFTCCFPLLLFSDMTPDTENVSNRLKVDSFSLYPLWFAADFSDVNHIATELGFKGFDDDGRVLFGADIKFPIGRDSVFGFSLAYRRSEQTAFVPTEESKTSERELRYTAGFAGVNFGKRFYLSENIFLLPSLMAGYGEHRLHMVSSDLRVIYNWAGIYEGFVGGEQSSVSLLKHYAILQPKLDMSYRLSGSLFLNMEIGYILGFSNIDWQVKNIIGYTYYIDGAPNTSFNGFTISIGPSLKF